MGGVEGGLDKVGANVAKILNFFFCSLVVLGTERGLGDKTFASSLQGEWKGVRGCVCLEGWVTLLADLVVCKVEFRGDIVENDVGASFEMVKHLGFAEVDVLPSLEEEAVARDEVDGAEVLVCGKITPCCARRECFLDVYVERPVGHSGRVWLALCDLELDGKGKLVVFSVGVRLEDVAMGAELWVTDVVRVEGVGGRDGPAEYVFSQRHERHIEEEPEAV